ncbi:MAG: radical SAM protein, partial [Azoarcus sp.]|nr:radical SAM protein [Azoarcus sp.]
MNRLQNRQQSRLKTARIIPIQPVGSLASGQTNLAAASGALDFRAPLPLSLYVHFPWCVRKCPYCDFNSHPLRGNLPEAEYIAALIADLESALPLVWGRRIVSVFFGGGTPSLLSASGLDTLMSAIRTRLPLVSDAEITLEANPGAVETDKFAAFRDAGVNRLSLGIQSFNPQ